MKVKYRIGKNLQVELSKNHIHANYFVVIKGDIPTTLFSFPLSPVAGYSSYIIQHITAIYISF